MRTRNQYGITLIEMMIVVAIIGILAAISYPGYREHVQRSNRTEAMNELTRIANLQEQFFADNRNYAASLTDLGLAADPLTTPSGLYQVTVSARTVRTFTITATAQGTQATDACTTMSINQAGAKTAADIDCWR